MNALHQFSFIVLSLVVGSAIAATGRLAAEEVSDFLPKEGSIDFVAEIAPIFDRRCGGCHSGKLAKAGFDIEDRDTVLGYLEPGDPENSSLWADYLNAESAGHDPTTSVMPLSGPLPDYELEMIRRWVEQGATWPEKIRFVRAVGVPEQPLPPKESESTWERFCAFLGYFHPATVHFPVALLMFGAASAALSFFTAGRAIYVAYYCLWWGTFFAILSSLMGWCFAAEKGYPAWNVVPTEESIEAASAVFRHRWLGIATTLSSILVLVTAVVANRKPNTVWRHVWRVGFLVVALLVSIVGHQGGELVYGDIVSKAISRLMGE